MSNSSPLPPPPPPGGSFTPAPAPAKKGLGVLGWIAIGCGGLLLLSAIAFFAIGYFAVKKVKDIAENPALAAAKVIDFANPDIELVGTDEQARTVTFKKVANGETVTFSWEDLEKGRISFTDSDGKNTTLGVDEESGTAGMVVRDASGEVSEKFSLTNKQEPPAWLPLPEGVTQEGGWVAEDAQGVKGLLSFKHQGDRASVLEFFRTNLESRGFVLETSSYQAGDAGLEVISATAEDGRKATVTIGGEVGVFAVTFESPKGSAE